MGENGELITQAVRFDIFTRQWNDEKREWEGTALKAFETPDGKMRLKGIASSTIKDLHGDNMLASALEDMERQANAGLTIFGNHSYIVPEDDYGYVETASIKQAGIVDADGDPIYDLKFEIAINDENERAVKTWRSIHKKAATGKGGLGLSIGAMIPPGGAVRDKKSGALTIAHVELLETSIVGIPANPRSWIENAVRASMTTAKAATTIPLGQPQLTLDADAGTYRIEGHLDGIHLGVEDTTHAALDVTEQEALPTVTDAAEELDGGGSQPGSSSITDPEVTDSKIRVIEIDTGDDSGGSSSQGASQSEPAPVAEEDTDEEDEFAAGDDVLASASEIVGEAETVMASLEPGVSATFQQLLTLTDSLTRELTASIGRESEARAEKAAAERQRDEVVVMAGKIISGTNAVLTKLADLPVGRRTKFMDATAQFSELEGIYSADFLTLLRSKNR